MSKKELREVKDDITRVIQPLRVLQPRVRHGIHALLELVGRFGVVIGLTILGLTNHPHWPNHPPREESSTTANTP
ncbi:hypothetical protein [[Eubacterium] cellulosolvens]